MVVGIVTWELHLAGCQSLKDKRQILKSLKDRLHREHQVSVAEVDLQDDPRRAMLGIALAASSVPVCQSVLDHVLGKIRESRDCVLSDHQQEIITGC